MSKTIFTEQLFHGTVIEVIPDTSFTVSLLGEFGDNFPIDSCLVGAVKFNLCPGSRILVGDFVRINVDVIREEQ